MKIAVSRIVNAAVIVILISVVNFDCKDGNISSNTSNICGNWSIEPPYRCGEAIIFDGIR